MQSFISYFRRLTSCVFGDDNFTQEDNNSLSDCPICLEPLTTDTMVQRWTCDHAFHRQCVERWNRDCPMCRTHVLREQIGVIDNVTWSISRNPHCRLDINAMDRISKVPEQHTEIYRDLWNDRCCIQQNHPMIFAQPYGVTVICRQCVTIQCFNLSHNSTND